MVPPAAGVVILVQFPFSDLSRTKLRPAVVLADAGRGDHLVARDDRPDMDLPQRHLHVEFTQYPQQVLGVLPMFLFARTRVDIDRLAQEGKGRKLILVVGMRHEQGFGLLGLLRLDDIELAQQ